MDGEKTHIKNKEMKMKYTSGIFAVMFVIAGICSGCDKNKEAVPAKPDATEVADKNWEPETAVSAGHEHGAECDH